MDLAHAAFHLLYRLVFMFFHPFQHARFDIAKMVDSISQKRGAEHGDIGADHQQLNDVLGPVHAAGCGQVGADTAV